MAASNDSAIEFTPTVSGTYLFALTVSDSDGGNATLIQTVNVDPSLIDLASLSGDEGDVFAFDASGVSELDSNATRTYRWQVTRGNVVVTGDQFDFCLCAT